MRVLRERFGVSQRRACRVVGQHRSTQRLDPPVPDDEETELRAWLRDVLAGAAAVGVAARRDGLRAEGRRDQQQAGAAPVARGRTESAVPETQEAASWDRHRVGAMCPIAPNALWALDFQFDTTVDGRTLKLLNVVDEFTRECPAIVVDRNIDADKVVATLDKIRR